jgi:DNA-binding MarR family transcriptional regulator
MCTTVTAFVAGLMRKMSPVFWEATQMLEDVVEGSGITASEFAVTSSINILGSVTPTELARTLGLSPTTLSAMIERLVRKGQVERLRHPDDGRSYVLEPTARGKATQAAIGVRFRKAIVEVRGHLGEDADGVLTALRRLEGALRATIASP